MTALHSSERPGSRTAISKTMAVLEAVLERSRLCEIAEVAGLSNSTTHRILAELVSLGWVYYDQDRRRYHAGVAMHRLAGALADDRHVARLAMPHLVELNRRTGFTVYLGLESSGIITYAAKLDGASGYRMLSRVGGSVPMHSSAIGKAVLATWGEEDVRRWASQHELEQITPNTHHELGSLLTDLRLCRKRAWAFEDGENEPLLSGIAAAVFSSSGEAIGGVGVSAMHAELPSGMAKDIARYVQSAAQAISESLAAPTCA